MPSPATSRIVEAQGEREGRRAAIAALEAELWRRDFPEALLDRAQSAWRELDAQYERAGVRRHDFLIVIPVADSPLHLEDCLASLLHQCLAYGYGGQERGRWRRVEVLLADDSGDPECIRRQRELARRYSTAGLTTRYFGLEQQRALLDAFQGLDLTPILGRHEPDAFHHKGQAMMRNLAYLECARLVAASPERNFLLYSIDADQEFRVNIPSADGGRWTAALNYFFLLDELFREREIQILTGKVVGDPPVSPAVMAGNFLEDVLGFLAEMAAAAPDAPYPQPRVGAGGDAAYHDMADLFGFRQEAAAYRYRCPLPGTPDHAACFDAFAQRLNRFFHGEHPTRVTWHEAREPAAVQPARTIYTGNYVFRPEALAWFIPFAPLRLRMSGPTMGRMLKAELGDRFVSAALPMLHKRAVEATGQSEFRPGVREERRNVDLTGEFERQFHGDVMLFSMVRLTEQGYPDAMPEAPEALLAAVAEEMREKYAMRHAALRQRLAELEGLLEDRARWWHGRPALAEFRAFARNLERNFGPESEALRRIDDPALREQWRRRQAAAVSGWRQDREVWGKALERARRLGAA